MGRLGTWFFFFIDPGEAVAAHVSLVRVFATQSTPGHIE